MSDKTEVRERNLFLHVGQRHTEDPIFPRRSSPAVAHLKSPFYGTAGEGEAPETMHQFWQEDDHGGADGGPRSDDARLARTAPPARLQSSSELKVVLLSGYVHFRLVRTNLEEDLERGAEGAGVAAPRAPRKRQRRLPPPTEADDDSPGEVVTIDPDE